MQRKSPIKTRPKSTDTQVRRLIRKLDALAASGTGGLSTDWEKGFISSVRDRLQTYGSAFTDPEKGQLDASLSFRQDFKVHEIRRLIRHRVRKGKSR